MRLSPTHPSTKLPAISTYIELVSLDTFWDVTNPSCPHETLFLLPYLQEWDMHVQKTWPECPHVVRAALRDRVANAHGRAVLRTQSS